jgi:hypothetical protein
MEGDAMGHNSKAKEIVHILMESKYYFALSLQERYDLIRNILRKFPFSSRL